LAVDGEGTILLDTLKAAWDGQRPALLCLMHANNEIGTIQPVEAVGRLTREREIHFHVDAVQTAGHIPVNVAVIGCDTLALSAHKLGGPKGIGALYLRSSAVIENLHHGGSQESGRRAGTQNVAGIVGFGKAAQLALERMETEAARLAILRDELILGIEASIPGARLNGHRANRLPNNVNFSFEGVASDDLLLRLDLAGICASAGSACSSGSMEPSHVLQALHVPEKYLESSVRFSLGTFNTLEEVDRAVEIIQGQVERLRDISPIR
jgi:cysteine desulfurase